MKKKDSILKAWFEYQDVKQFENFLGAKMLKLNHPVEKEHLLDDWYNEVKEIESKIRAYNSHKEKYIRDGIKFSETDTEKGNYEGQLEAFIDQKNDQVHKQKNPFDLFSDTLPGPLSLNVVMCILMALDEVKKRLTVPEPEPVPDKKMNRNPYPQIFKGDDDKGYRLFESFVSEKIGDKQRGLHANYSFIYRIMVEDGGEIYDWIKDGHYRKWLNEEFDVDIEKTTLLDWCKTDTKIDTYNRLKKDIFNLK